MQTDENARLDDAMRRADELLVGSLRRDDRLRRRRRIAVGLGALAVLLLSVLVVQGVNRSRRVTAPPVLVESTSRPATQPAALSPEHLRTLDGKDWRRAFATGQALAAFSDTDTAWTVLSTNWRRIASFEARQQILKAFAFTPHHPRLLDVLDLGMKDPEPRVQAWAIGYLRSIAFDDFAVNTKRYDAWRAATAGRNVETVAAESAKAWIEKLKHSEAIAYDARDGQDVGNGLARYPAARDVVLAAGGADLAVRWLREWSGKADQHGDVLSFSVDLLRALRPDEHFLKRDVLPMLDANQPRDVREAAVRVLGACDAKWAVDPLLGVLRESAHSTDKQTKRLCWDVARALAEIGEARAIPHMIAVIASDNTYDTVYGVGYFGLAEITGVDYDASHDGAWWTQWWDRERLRFPEPARSTTIPVIEKRSASARALTGTLGAMLTLMLAASPEAGESPPKELTAGGNEQMKFFLNGPKTEKAPEEGYRLLLVLPGGDGSAEFRPFVSNVYVESLPDNYLLAQLVAPRWDAGEPKVVWPTEKSRVPKMKFTAEAFIDAVVAEVGKQHKIDAKHVYALGWSSGGPPVYAAAMRPKTPVTGAFVAMSVFKPDQLPPAKKLEGRAFYILHSPTDFIKMSFPRNAEKTLGASGGKSKLVTYEGGHGWHGDVFGNIRAGVEWLEKQPKETPKPEEKVKRQ